MKHKKELPKHLKEQLDSIERQLSHNYPAVVSKVSEIVTDLYYKNNHEKENSKFSIIKDTDGVFRLQSPLSVIKISDIKYIEVRDPGFLYQSYGKRVVAVLNSEILRSSGESEDVIDLIKVDFDTSSSEIEGIIKELARLIANKKS